MAEPTVTPASAPAAPAQPAAAAPAVSAVHAAVAAGDTGSYREARRAERVGKPLPEVTPKAEAAPAPAEADIEPATPGAPAAPAPQAISKRQQQINDYERRIAEQNERIRALETQHAPAAPAAPAQATAATPAEPEWKRFHSMPDAPKLADFESFEEHSAAMALFIADKRYEERSAAEHSRTEGQQLAAHETARISAFDARVTEVAKSDPALVGTIAPLAQALGNAGGAFRIIGQLALDSERGPEILRHFANDREALQKLAVLPESLRGLPTQAAVKRHIQLIVKEIGRLEGTFATAAAPDPTPPKTISDAPDTQTLGSRPAEATDPKAGAVKRGDTRAYRDMRRAERAAAVRR